MSVVPTLQSVEIPTLQLATSDDAATEQKPMRRDLETFKRHVQKCVQEVIHLRRENARILKGEMHCFHPDYPLASSLNIITYIILFDCILTVQWQSLYCKFKQH